MEQNTLVLDIKTVYDTHMNIAYKALVWELKYIQCSSG